MRYRTRRRILTPTEQLELFAWFKARKALGTFKTKAKELGVTQSCLHSALDRMKKRERRVIGAGQAETRSLVV